VSGFRIAVLFALVSVVPSVAMAQRASIIGTIVDDTKAVLPGVASRRPIRRDARSAR
jgi:hypothetical protein